MNDFVFNGYLNVSHDMLSSHSDKSKVEFSLVKKKRRIRLLNLTVKRIRNNYIPQSTSRRTRSARAPQASATETQFTIMAGSVEQNDAPESAEAGSPDAMEEETLGPQSNPQESQMTKDQWSAIKQVTDKVYRYRTKE